MGREEQENASIPCSDKPDSEENIRSGVGKEDTRGLIEGRGCCVGVAIGRSVGDASKDLLTESQMRNRASSSAMPLTPWAVYTLANKK